MENLKVASNPTTDTLVKTPLGELQQLNMHRRQFTREALEWGAKWIASVGKEGSAPLFMRVVEGEWDEKGGHVYFQGKKLVAQEDVQGLLKQEWYRQDVPKGIHSFHGYLMRKYVGIGRRAVADFVKSQEAWQLTRPLAKKKG